MNAHRRHTSTEPSLIDHGVAALNGWIGDYLVETGNGLSQPMALYRDNRPVDAGDVAIQPDAKVVLFVHGLGCNESTWRFATGQEGGSYGDLLAARHGYLPLALRYNTGLRISENGRLLARLLARLWAAEGRAVSELVLVGHSMGGLVIRSACHLGQQALHPWVTSVSHVVYIGSPHLGAPLEKATNVATHLLGRFDTTATRVIRDLLNTRSAGVKDLRFGNLVDDDWLDFDPDELLRNRRLPVPWLASARHHRIVGHVVPRAETLGDAMVRPASAGAEAHGLQPGAPLASDRVVIEGLDHVTLGHHPAVYDHIERWVTENE